MSIHIWNHIYTHILHIFCSAFFFWSNHFGISWENQRSYKPDTPNSRRFCKLLTLVWSIVRQSPTTVTVDCNSIRGMPETWPRFGCKNRSDHTARNPQYQTNRKGPPKEGQDVVIRTRSLVWPFLVASNGSNRSNFSDVHNQCLSRDECKIRTDQVNRNVTVEH